MSTAVPLIDLVLLVLEELELELETDFDISESTQDIVKLSKKNELSKYISEVENFSLIKRFRPFGYN
tara:strand:- start:2141 stop:2341 length:201 start_codon:yes stop_codon:yes gene_type:complete